MKTYRTFLEIAHSCYLVQICNKKFIDFYANIRYTVLSTFKEV